MSAKSPRLARTGGVFLSGREGRQPFVIVMLTPRISPLELICTVCLGAVGAQRQIGGKAVGLDEHLDLAAAGGALEVAEDVAAGLAPVAGDAARPGSSRRW